MHIVNKKMNYFSYRTYILISKKYSIITALYVIIF